MTKKLNLKVKTPRHISMHEMTVIKGARKKGATHKEIKAHIDQDRKFAGTYRGKGISTNTISRLLGKTHGKEYEKSISKVWEIHAKQTYQKSEFEELESRIKSLKERESFRKFARRIVERTKGDQYDVRVRYKAEDDTFEAESG